jgi:phosphoribosylformylglycinamidine synthase subunit PurQ / glutaminase
VLVKMGLLPGTSLSGKFQMEATLGLNDSGKFIAKWVYLKNERSGAGGKSPCAWTKNLPGVISMPIAHAEGKFIVKDKSLLKVLNENGQILFRYSSPSGEPAGDMFNPNGSVDDIAGICDPSGRIMGMMPHPERHVSRFQHPNWRRKDHANEATGAGLYIFNSGVDFARKNV